MIGLLSAPRTCGNQVWGCVGVLGLWYLSAPALLVGVSWALLHRADVRPAWEVALLGLAAGYMLERFAQVIGFVSVWARSPGLALVVAAAYAIAAFITARDARLPGRALAAVGLILLYPLTDLVAHTRATNDERSTLRHSPVPLLGPTVPAHYEIVGPGIEGGDQTYFAYTVSPTSFGDNPTTMRQMDQQIRVYVGPILDDFTPPTDCAAVTDSSPYSPGPTCTPAGPDIWRTPGNGETSYFIRRNGAIAVIQADAYQVPDQTLAALARTMTVRSPSYFTG